MEEGGGGAFFQTSLLIKCWQMLHGDLKLDGTFAEILKLKIPPKVSFVVWRIFLQRLPTKENLTKKNDELLDTGEHILLTCLKVLLVLGYVLFLTENNDCTASESFYTFYAACAL